MRPSGWPRPAWRRTKIDAGAWIEAARGQLNSISNRPLAEAHTLLGHVLRRSRSWLLTHPETILSRSDQARADALLARLLAGEPLPYILGRQEFYGLEFEVDRRVLIPRPETELLVEESLRWLAAHPRRRRAAEAGTGSGCIAVSLANRCPNLFITATDLSSPALPVAMRNAARLSPANLPHFVCCDLLTALNGPFDLICANLPYIPSAALSALPVTRYEPRLALDGGPDGLALVARLLADLARLAAPGALILLEVEAGHGQAAPALAHRLLPSARVDLLPDLAGHPRLLRVKLP